jgi:hypothetical protein
MINSYAACTALQEAGYKGARQEEVSAVDTTRRIVAEGSS